MQWTRCGFKMTRKLHWVKIVTEALVLHRALACLSDPSAYQIHNCSSFCWLSVLCLCSSSSVPVVLSYLLIDHCQFEGAEVVSLMRLIPFPEMKKERAFISKVSLNSLLPRYFFFNLTYIILILLSLFI